MKNSHNKILITGGASGIGFGMAQRFVQENNTVIICGRRAEALKEATDKLPGLLTKQADLATEAGREELYNWVAKEHPDVNVLVNNAGIQNWMHVADADFYKKAKEEITTNIEAPLHLTSLFLKLKSLNAVLNVSSGLSFVPFIKVPVYSATKAFFHSFTLSLREMLRAKNIEVIEVIPPALNTDLGGKGLHDHAPPVSDFIESIFSQLHERKTELTFGFSDVRHKASKEIVDPVFKQMNQLG